MQDVIDRLAAYEDTGLMPEEVERLTAQEPNTPLTLEELLKLEGELVWIERHDGSPSRWVLIEAVTKTFLHTYGCGVLEWEELGNTWLAYRRKPEEGTT